MPTKLFKVNIYDVETTYTGTNQPTELRDAIRTADVQLLGDREKNINGKIRRLDHSQQRDDMFLLNFVTFQYSGPGRVRRQQPTAAIALRPDESFAPETAMLYDHSSNLALVESAQGSMGPSAIVRYFEEFADRGTTYTMIPRVDNDAAARARRHQTIRNLKMRVALGPITDLDREAGIDPVKAFGTGYGAGYINIEMQVERARDRSLTLETVQKLISHFTSGMTGLPQITQLRVTGREHDDEPLELIDLVQHRQRNQLVLAIDDTTRQIHYSTRWDALLRTHQKFL